MKTLYESIFDIEDNIKTVDKDIINDWFEKNAKGKYKFILLKNGYLKIWGDIIIKNYEGETFPENIKISFFDGNLTIEKCPNLISLEGLFEYPITLKGSFAINNCPHLTSLVGGPYIVDNNFNCVGNTNLASLEGAPVIVGIANIMKNNKRWSEKQVQKYISARRINCNADDAEAVLLESQIDESLNEPHLLQLDIQLKKYFKNIEAIKQNLYKYQWELPSIKKYLNPIKQYKWDEIDMSMVQEGKPDAQMLKACRALLAGHGDGIILLQNYDDEYTDIISGFKTYMHIPTAKTDEYIKDFYKDWGKIKDEDKKSMDDFFNWGFEYFKRIEIEKCMRHSTPVKTTEAIDFIKNAYYVVIFKFSGQDVDDLSKYNITTQRREAKEGMWKPGDEEFNRKFAEININRYKKMVGQLRITKRKNDFLALNDKVEKILMRYSNLNKKVITNPEKFEYIYRIQSIIDDIGHMPTYREINRKHGIYDTKKGLLNYMYDISNYYVELSNGTNLNTSRLLETIKNIEEQINLILSRLDTELKSLGV